MTKQYREERVRETEFPAGDRGSASNIPLHCIYPPWNQDGQTVDKKLFSPSGENSPFRR